MRHYCCNFKNLHQCSLNQRLIFPNGQNNHNTVKKVILTYNKFEILQIFSQIPNDQKENIICTIDDVRGYFLGPPHGTTPAAVIANKIELLEPLESVKTLKVKKSNPSCKSVYDFFLYLA